MQGKGGWGEDSPSSLPWLPPAPRLCTSRAAGLMTAQTCSHSGAWQSGDMGSAGGTLCCYPGQVTSPINGFHSDKLTASQAAGEHWMG